MLTAGAAHAAMRRLPLAPLARILGGRAPLVLAPHPDDESLGCGGLLAASAAAGLDPAVLVLTDGAASHPGSARFPAPRLRALREQEARAAVAALGVAPGRIGFLRLPDAACPGADPTAGSSDDPLFEAAVEAILAHARPARVILAPWRHDPHCDHEAAHRLAACAAARAGLTHLAYPVWGWTLATDTPLAGPAPQGWRLDIGPHLAAKRAAVAAHRSQASDLIDDDPSGFRLPAALLDLMLGPFETVLSPP